MPESRAASCGRNPRLRTASRGSRHTLLQRDDPRAPGGRPGAREVGSLSVTHFVARLLARGQATGSKTAPSSSTLQSTLRATPSFAFDRSRLDGAAQAELDGLLHRVHGLNSHYGMGKAGIAQSASVVGHTDSIGSRRYNQRLSVQRAQTTADYLVINGVRPEAISVSGAGESQPVASNRNRAGRAANRRADVTVHALIAP